MIRLLRKLLARIDVVFRLPHGVRYDSAELACLPRLTAIDAKLNPDALEPSERKLVLEFVLPTQDHAREDQ